LIDYCFLRFSIQGGPVAGVMYSPVDDAIEAKCKAEDAERRAAAKARQAKLTPRSRKRH
jgi:hypothetical protein